MEDVPALRRSGACGQTRGGGIAGPSAAHDAAMSLRQRRRLKRRIESERRKAQWHR
jgi:hypothetical protein